MGELEDTEESRGIMGKTGDTEKSWNYRIMGETGDTENTEESRGIMGELEDTEDTEES